MDGNYFAENIQIDGQVKKTKKTISIPTLIISLVTTIVLVVIVLNNWANIIEILGFDVEVVENGNFEKLVVGDEVALSGDIFDDGDLVNYTHLLDSKEYGELGLKSQNINLNNYEDEVYLEGIVEKIQQGISVIEVDTIYSLDMTEKKDIEDENLSGYVVEEKYLANIGLYLDFNFFDKYSLLNNGENGVLKIKNIESNQIINLDYFVCDTSVVDQNCDRFNEMFAVSSVEKFIQSDGTAYYKQPEVDSWFFSNSSLFGYFINDVDDSAVKELVKYIKIVNEDFVFKNILDKLDSVCWKPGVTMKNIKEHTLFLKNNELYLDIKGDDGLESRLFCEIKVDVIAKNMSKLVKLEVVEDMMDPNSDDEIDVSGKNKNIDDTGIIVSENFDWDSDVEQFPINLDKTLEFTSRRGHTIVFPSSNIAYAGRSLQENFNQPGVNCFSVMNVVKYAEKEEVDQKGSVKIYECSMKEGFNDSSETLIHKEVGDKDFVIKIVDPSWIQFANNINIIIK